MIHARNDYNRIQDPEGKIGEDEPVFMVRAKDKLAPATMRFWANCAEQEGVDEEMVEMVHRHADLMEQWQFIHGCKLPDLWRD